MRKYLGYTGAAAMVILAGCGGSGSGDPPAPSQGLWFTSSPPGGTDSNGALLITSSGELWGFEDRGAGQVALLHQAGVPFSGTSFNVPMFTYDGTTREAGRVEASFVPRTTITGSYTVAGQARAFDGRYDAAIYEASPNLAALAGAFNVNDGNGTLTLNATGAFTGTLSSGCSFSGQLGADGSGRNFYRVSVTFGAAPCPSPNTVAHGVAVPTREGGLVAGVISANFGQAFLLDRQGTGGGGSIGGGTGGDTGGDAAPPPDAGAPIGSPDEGAPDAPEPTPTEPTPTEPTPTEPTPTEPTPTEPTPTEPTPTEPTPTEPTPTEPPPATGSPDEGAPDAQTPAPGTTEPPPDEAFA